MLPTHSAVIADTSCFILLTKINELELLKKLYISVYTTPEVAAEFKYELPEWIIVQQVKDKENFYSLQKEIDSGEASAIALSYEISEAILGSADYYQDVIKSRSLAIFA